MPEILQTVDRSQGLEDNSAPRNTSESLYLFLVPPAQETIAGQCSKQSTFIVQNTANPFLFHDEIRSGSALRRAVLRTGVRCLEWILGLRDLAALYDRIKQNESEDILESALRDLDIRYELINGSLDSIPKEGPVAIVANHPFGGIEGVIMAHLLRKIRPDFRIMANYMLGRIPELRDRFILVDPFGAQGSFRKNLGPLRETMEWLNGGHLLATFPSGTVSHLDFQKRTIADPEWSATIAGIIRKSKAQVLPIFFHGFNGPLFQIAGLIHPRLRTALLARQVINKKHSTIRLTIGTPIPSQRLQSFNSDRDLTAYLRIRTYVLEDKDEQDRRFVLRSLPRLPRRIQASKDIVAPAEKRLLLEEIERLSANQLLVESGSSAVYFARARQIPNILHEIGRLREYTFRRAHEGTGKAIDLDRFDDYYVHLFLWNRTAQEVVGAYRLGRVDRILRRVGVSGLYTHTLFHYDEHLLHQIGPALELGRSFIRPEYQRHFTSLLLLWKGIGQYVVRYPRYKVLFGPVSINNEYETFTRQLIVSFLKENNFLPQLGRMIKPRNPMPKRHLPGIDSSTLSMVVRDVDDMDELISEIEAEQKGVPVLLRQYLKLNGKLIGFNVDRDFGDVLDGLILVDLTETDTRLRERYLGKEGSGHFMRHHQKLTP